MRSILLFLDTQSWQDSEENSADDRRMSETKSVVVSLTEVFRAPLEAKGADLSSILDEIEYSELTLGLDATHTRKFGINCKHHLTP